VITAYHAHPRTERRLLRQRRVSHPL
jgi:hypothetical protein